MDVPVDVTQKKLGTNEDFGKKGDDAGEEDAAGQLGRPHRFRAGSSRDARGIPEGRVYSLQRAIHTAIHARR